MFQGTFNRSPEGAFGKRGRQVVRESHGQKVAVQRHVVDATDSDHDTGAGHRRLERRGIGDRIRRVADVDDQKIEFARPFGKGQRLIDGVAKSLSEEFFKRFDAETERLYPAQESAAAVSAPEADATQAKGWPTWAWTFPCTPELPASPKPRWLPPSLWRCCPWSTLAF